MLLSLLKHNPWAGDSITILTCNETPLSEHNRVILNSICGNITYRDIDPETYQNIKIKESEKRDVLPLLYKLEAFNLAENDAVIYISSFSLCISNLDFIFKSGSSMVVADTGHSAKSTRNPNQMVTVSEFNTSIMLISKEVLAKNISGKIIGRLSNVRNINPILLDSKIHDSLRLEEIDTGYLPLNKVIKKSRFADSKYNRFLALKKNISLISLDIGVNQRVKSQAAFMYKKMDSLWQSCNQQGEWYTESKDQRLAKDHISSYLERGRLKRANKKIDPDLRLDYSKSDLYDSDFCVMITTYNRKKCIEKLTRSLKEIYDCKIIVIDDCSEDSIDTSNIDTYIKLSINNGKKGWWKTVNLLWDKAMSYNCKYYIMMPDDALPNENMFDEAVRLWDSINDPLKIAMHLANNDRKRNWTGYNRTHYNDEIFKTQTTEFSFICKKDFIRYIIPPISPYRWSKNKLLGSGVGDKLNRYWVSKNRNIYGVKKSLVKMNLDCQESVMNPEERKNNPWILK